MKGPIRSLRGATVYESACCSVLRSRTFQIPPKSQCGEATYAVAHTSNVAGGIVVVTCSGVAVGGGADASAGGWKDAVLAGQGLRATALCRSPPGSVGMMVRPPRAAGFT